MKKTILLPCIPLWIHSLTLAPVVAALSLFPAKASPVERTLLERILKHAGGELLERTARETAEHSAAAALRSLGKTGAEEAVKRGGLPLLQAAARHGDDVWHLAGRVPESTRFLASKPAEALHLAGRFGDDAVRLESRVPGMAQKAVEHFGPKSLGPLSKAAPAEVNHLIGYAGKAQNPEVRKKLFDLWVQRGGAILEVLERHKALIFTGGLTLAILDVADGIREAIPETLPRIPAIIPPEAPVIVGTKLGNGLQWAVVLLSAAMSYRMITGGRNPTRKPKKP
jgi:hypothetical protein